MTASRCKGCNGEIVWGTTAGGKAMPLDARAVTMWLIDGDGAQTGSPKIRPIQVRVSHFSTCPSAEEFRRPR